MIIFPVGISGSGKSRYGDYLKEKYHFEIVCPDELRHDLFGNINDQSHNEVVFEEAYKLTRNLLSRNKHVYFSATNLNLYRAINPIRDLLKNDHIPLFFFFFKDSLDIHLCNHRIREDLRNRKLRSNVPWDILQNQHLKFMKAHTIEFRGNLVKDLSTNNNGIPSACISDSDPFAQFETSIRPFLDNSPIYVKPMD